MGKGIFITGTDTEVGKTRVTAGLAAVLHRRWGGVTSEEQEAPPTFVSSQAQHGQSGFGCEKCLPVRLWKPVQSGVATDGPDADSWRLQQESGLPPTDEAVASVTLAAPLAPWIAAERAGTVIDYAALLAEGKRRLSRPEFWLIEGAGGFLVPLTGERLVADLAAELGLPVLIVARAGLGTVNHTLLTVAAVRQRGLQVLGVVLNGWRPGEEQATLENAMMIERFGAVRVLGRLPWLPFMPETGESRACWRERWSDAVERGMDIGLLENMLFGRAGSDFCR